MHYINTMNKLSDEKRTMILKALVEGNSMRATARLTGTSKNTVSRLLKNSAHIASNSTMLWSRT